MDDLVKFAENELIKKGYYGMPVYDDKIAESILDLVKLYDSQDHSGASSCIVINAFFALIKGEEL